MSKNGHRDRVSDTAKAVAQWHREKAIRHWLAGRWPEYKRHINIADSLTRRG